MRGDLKEILADESVIEVPGWKGWLLVNRIIITVRPGRKGKDDATIWNNERNEGPLRDELSFIEDYLAIEMVRFGDKLRFERDVSEDTLDMLVPSMLLQPLVENSIKHGLRNKVEGGTIRIRTRRTENRLHLMVEDDGVGIPDEKLATLLDRGIGVNNVHERLRVLFGNEYRMWIESQPGEGVRIQIEVPELQTAIAV